MSSHQTVSGTLSAVGSASAEFFLRPGEEVSITLTFTGTAKIALAYALGSPAQAYQPIQTWEASVTATKYVNTSLQPQYLVLLAQRIGVGGSVAYTMADVSGDQILFERYAADGQLVFRITDEGVVGQPFDVTAFGAKGDGVTDDTAAIQAAISSAATGWTSGDPFGYGGVVFFPTGVYGVSADIDIPEQVLLQGSGLRVTVIRWIGAGNPTNAVVTSNIDNRFSFVHATGIKDLTIDANDEAVGLKIRGWNEACQLENVEVREYTDATDGGVQILSASAGSNTSTSQNVHFKGLWLGGKTGARNLLLDGCNRLTFDNVTIFLSNYNASTNPGPMLTGIELRQVCRQNVFINPNVEDCTRAYDIGTTAAVSGNTFINPLSDAPVGDPPADTTIGSVTGSMGFVVRSTAGATWGQIVGGMRSRYYDYVYFDDALGISIAGAGGASYSNLTGYFGPASGIYTTPHISRHVTFTDADATPSVARGNVFSANNSGATSITDFDDGTEFQEITVRFTNSNTTIVDGVPIQLAGGANFVGSSNDLLTLVRYGTTWYEKARSVN